MKCFGVVAIDCFIQNALLVNGVIFPHVTTVNFHMYMIAFICLFTQLLPKYFRTPAVQFSRSVVSNSLWPPWTAAHQASLSITNSQSLLRLMSIESLMPSNHLILCRPLLLLPSIFPSIRVFSNESALCIRWPSVGVSVSASELPMNIQDWFPLGWTGWILLHSKGL